MKAKHCILFQVLVHDPPQGVPPPAQGQKGSNPGPATTPIHDDAPRLRKFIARPSAGLRIRVHPTLQSEQVGVLPVEGIVSIVDELQGRYSVHS